MDKKSRLVCKFDDGKEIFFLDFDDDGRCTGRDPDDLCVSTNMGIASFVGALAGRVYPVNERNRQCVVVALQRHKALLESLNKVPAKPSAEIKAWIKETKKELRNIDAEIAQLTGKNPAPHRKEIQ